MSWAGYIKEVCDLLRQNESAIVQHQKLIEERGLDYYEAVYVTGEALRRVYGEGAPDYLTTESKHADLPKHRQPKNIEEKAWELYRQIQHEERETVLEIGQYLQDLACNLNSRY